MKNIAVLSIFIAMELCQPSRAGEFFGLGMLPGDDSQNRATALSGDGDIVTGISGGKVFRWTTATGMQELDLLVGPVNGESSFDSITSVTALSTDGSIMAGYGEIDSVTEGFRWSAETGLEWLGRVPDAVGNAFPAAMSDDGAIIVGGYLGTGCGGCLAPFRWTQDDGATGLMSCVEIGTARAISADGSTIVGYVDFVPFPTECRDTPSGGHAFRWSDPSGAELLLDNLGSSSHGAWDVSADGSIVVAFNHEKSFIFDDLDGLETIDDFTAQAIADDGSVVVGGLDEGIGVWNKADGLRQLQDILGEGGESMIGWTRLWPVDTSSDGSVIVGNGLNPSGNTEAWMAIMPERTVCDFNGDGFCDGTDINQLMTDAATDGTSTDLNGDRIANNADRDQWLALAGPKNGFAGPLLVGDSDTNGTVDASDLNALALSWQNPGVFNWTNGNFSVAGGPGINAADLNALALNWRASSVAAASQAVPEPTGLSCLLFAIVGAWLTVGRQSATR